MATASTAAIQDGPAISASSRSHRPASLSYLSERAGARRLRRDAAAQLGWNLAALHNGKRLIGSGQVRNGEPSNAVVWPGTQGRKARTMAPETLGVCRKPRWGTLGTPIGYYSGPGAKRNFPVILPSRSGVCRFSGTTRGAGHLCAGHAANGAV